MRHRGYASTHAVLTEHSELRHQPHMICNLITLKTADWQHLQIPMGMGGKFWFQNRARARKWVSKALKPQHLPKSSLSHWYWSTSPINSSRQIQTQPPLPLPPPPAPHPPITSLYKEPLWGCRAFGELLVLPIDGGVHGVGEPLSGRRGWKASCQKNTPKKCRHARGGDLLQAPETARGRFDLWPPLPCPTPPVTHPNPLTLARKLPMIILIWEWVYVRSVMDFF